IAVRRRTGGWWWCRRDSDRYVGDEAVQDVGGGLLNAGIHITGPHQTPGPGLAAGGEHPAATQGLVDRGIVGVGDAGGIGVGRVGDQGGRLGLTDRAWELLEQSVGFEAGQT